MRTCKYRRRTRMESCMSGVIFLSSWPSGASLPSLPFTHPFSLSFFCRILCVLMSCGAGVYSGLFLKENGEQELLDLVP